MPNTRETLIELIDEAEEHATDICVLHDSCEDCPGRKYGNKCRDYLKADHLIANGVTLAEQLASSSKQLASSEWIPVTERLPEVENEVLILARHGKRNVITTGMYEDGRMNTEDSDWWWETEGFEYDEELDVHIIPEGWWEYKHYIDDDAHNYAIDGVVTHWMPLPKAPKIESI